MIAALFVALSLVNAAPAAKTVTSKDNGKTVTIAKSQQLRIELSECGSCGYSWKTTTKPDPTVLSRRPTLHKDQTCEPPCTGGEDTIVFRYSGKGTGSTKIRLEYFGPGKSKSSKSFRITVRVR
jgi:predicted secreted protein